jgi:hypothetical protein
LHFENYFTAEAKYSIGYVNFTALWQGRGNTNY